MKRAVVFSPIWGLGCIFLVLSSSCRHSDISGDGLSDAVNFSAEVLQGPLGKGVPVAGANLTQWAVFGYRQGDRLWSDQLEGAVLPSLFYDVPVDKQSDGSWSYGTPVAWGGLAYDYYAFFGYAPKATGVYRDPENPMGNNLEVVGTSSTAGVAQLNYETLADVTNQIDLLAGMRTNLPASNKVTMQLGHMLSQIRFTAWSAQAGVTPVSIAINGVQYKGIFSSKGGKASWLSTDPVVRGFDLRGNYPVLSVKEDLPTDLSADGRSFMLLPQDLTTNTTATIDIVALVGGVEVVSTPYVINENWEAGKSYTYVLKLGGSPTEELIVTDVLVTDWVVDSEEDMSTTPVGYDVNPPKEDQYVEINGVRWATGNLVAKNKYQCVVGAPTDGGLYFQFGSLIGYKGGDLANGGKGVGSNPYTTAGTQWWNGAGGWSWINDAKVWPEDMAGTPSSWPQETSGTAHQWYFSGDGVTSGEINVNDPTKGVGDPCTYYLGDPWRQPTRAEYKTLFNNVNNNTGWGSVPSWSWVTSPYNGAQRTGNTLFFPASGRRGNSDGSFTGVTTEGYSRSSSNINNMEGSYLSFADVLVSPENYNYRSFGLPVRCVSDAPPLPINPPRADQYVEIDGLKWTKGHLVAKSSSNNRECVVGDPTDGGLYFQFGSLIGWKGGATANNGTGVGSNPNTSAATEWWGGARLWSWSNDAMVWPAAMDGNQPTAWSPNAPQSAEAAAFKKWYFDFSGTSQNGSINYSTDRSDIRAYTHPMLGALKEGKMASLGIGDPCTYYLGDPWRLPTEAEYTVLDVAGRGSWTTNGGMNGRWLGTSPGTASSVFFPASGMRNYMSGAFMNVTTYGLGGSSSVQDDAGIRALYFYSYSVYPSYSTHRSAANPARCVSGTYVPPSNPVNPPTASDYVEIDGLKWTKGNLVADGSSGCKVGAPTDGGLYFQFGSLIGWKGGATANNGTGVGSNPNTATGTQWWGGATSWNWSNDAMVWPLAMAGTPSSWPQATSGTEHQWFFSGRGATSGEINVNDPTKGVGDPCTYYLGDPWRTPTAAEYKTLFDKVENNTAWGSVASWSWVTSPYNGAQRTGNNLFFPASGYRDTANGSFHYVTTYGHYWSSSVYDATYGLHLLFGSSWVYPQYSYFRSSGFPVRCVSGTYVKPNPVNPPTASDYVEIDGVKWAKGNLVASSSTASGSNGCKVGAPTDGGLYFQFGSLIGYKGGATANNGTGVGSNPYTGSGTEWWGGAGSWSWSNDAMVWPTAMASTPAVWSPNAEQATEANAFQKWYFDFSGTSQNGSINYSTVQSDIRSYTHPTLGALKEGKMASLGIGDPCTYYLGAPWRTPTAAEYLTLLGDGGANTNKGVPLKVNNYDLFFPASGYRTSSNGSFTNVTTYGYGWSSSVSYATGGLSLDFDSSWVYPQSSTNRSFGFPVRCVAK